MNREKQCEVEAKGYMLEIRHAVCVAPILESIVQDVLGMAILAAERLRERDALRDARHADEAPALNDPGTAGLGKA